MARFFISHSSADNPAAERVRDALAELGHESAFLDVDPEQGLKVGQRWQDQLFEHLRASSAVLFLTSEASNASRWCHAELAVARWLRKPVVPLLMPGALPHEVLADLHALPYPSDEDRLRSLLARAAAELGIEQEQPWDPDQSPFPGLRPFGEEYAPVFFGRDAEIAQLADLLDPAGWGERSLVVPVLGPSGSGKSSLARAGLLPRIRPRADWIVVDPFTPLDAPLDELALAMAHAAKRAEVDADEDSCRELIHSAGGLAEYVRRFRSAGAVQEPGRLLVVVDQGEQLVTITPERRRLEFLAALGHAFESPSPLRMVMTVRTDQWDEVLDQPLDQHLSPTVLHVGPLSRYQLAAVIEEPARRALIEFEAGLVQRMVEETGSGAALPFLAFALSQLTADGRAADSRRFVSHEDFERVGGVQGGIASQADMTVARSGMETQTVATCLLPLVALAAGSPVGRRARAGGLSEVQKQVLDLFVDARLVRLTTEGEADSYSPSHEALFSAWPPLRTLVEERRTDLAVRDRLDRQSADWTAAGKGASGLLAGLALAAARDWAERSPDLVSPDTASFIAASERQQRRRRMARIGAAGAILALALAVGVVLVLSAASARRQATTARAGELIARAELQRERDPVTAALALTEAHALAPDHADFVAAATAVIESPGRGVVVEGHTDPGALGLSVAAAAPVAVSWSADRAAVWDLRDEQLLHELPATGLAAMRPDGRIVATVGDDGITLWDVASSLAEPQSLSTIRSGAAQLLFSAEGGRLLVGDSDGAITVWNVSQPSAPLPGIGWHAHAGASLAMELDETSQRLVTAGADGKIRQWDDQGTEVGPELDFAYQQVAFLDLHQGRVLAAGVGLGAVVKVFDADSGELREELPPAGTGEGLAAIPQPRWAAAFSADGSAVAVFDLAGKGTLHEVPSGRSTGELRGHSGLVTRAAVAGSELVTASLDGTIRIWLLETPPAAETASDLQDQLCEAFGSRFDEARWSALFGDVSFEPACGSRPPPPLPEDELTAPAPSVPPAPIIANSALVERFDDISGGWTLGEQTDEQGRRLYEMEAGVYRVLLDLDVENWYYWSPVDVEVESSYGLASVAEGTGGSCGLMVGSTDDTAVTVSLDQTTGTGLVQTFGDETYVVTRFVTDARPGRVEISLLVEGTLGHVLVDGERAAIVREPALERIDQAGVVAGGGANAVCTFDRFEVSTP